MRNRALVLTLSVLLGLVGSCERAREKPEKEGRITRDETVRIAYVKWSTEIASTNLVKAVLQEKLGYHCEIVPMSADEMWESVASGETDAMVSAWLPGTHEHFYREYKDRVVDLGPNLTGTQIGLLVPDVSVGRQTGQRGIRHEPYIKADSIEDLPQYADMFQHHIVGIDPEAGIMKKTREAIKAYNLGNRYNLVESSEKEMTGALAEAIGAQKWIVVTGWYPHWMFGRWKLKFLEDPQKVYGGKEHINTIARKGLKEDMPDAYMFLDNFNWDPEEMARLMLWIKETDGLYPYEQANRWIKTNPKKVEKWLSMVEASNKNRGGE